MFLYYKYVQLRAKHGQLFRYVLLFKVLRGVFFFIVIRILLHTNIIKGVASAKYFLWFVMLHIFLVIAGAVKGVTACLAFLSVLEEPGILSFPGFVINS